MSTRQTIDPDDDLSRVSSMSWWLGWVMWGAGIVIGWNVCRTWSLVRRAEETIIMTTFFDGDFADRVAEAAALGQRVNARRARLRRSLTTVERVALTLLEAGHGKKIGECTDRQACATRTCIHFAPDTELAQVAVKAVRDADWGD